MLPLHETVLDSAVLTIRRVLALVLLAAVACVLLARAGSEWAVVLALVCGGVLVAWLVERSP